MNKLCITAVQMNTAWEDYEQNLANVKKYVEKYSSQSDLLVFPEMFLTGFSMNVQHLAISPQHEYILQLQQWAVNSNVSLAGSLMIKEEEHFYNRFFYFHSKGNIDCYNKRHLFRMVNEHKYYTAGKEKILIRENNFTLMPSVCYDLRFPVWLRNQNNVYDVLIIVANWPFSRIESWKKLLAARAIENQAYVIGVNRCGIDNNQILYNGNTLILDYKGDIIAQANNNTEESIQAVLDKSLLEQFRKDFPVALDADNFNLIY